MRKKRAKMTSNTKGLRNAETLMNAIVSYSV